MFESFETNGKIFMKWKHQKKPFKGGLKKRCSENMQLIYRKTPMLKCEFNQVALQLY